MRQERTCVFDAVALQRVRSKSVLGSEAEYSLDAHVSQLAGYQLLHPNDLSVKPPLCLPGGGSVGEGLQGV